MASLPTRMDRWGRLGGARVGVERVAYPRDADAIGAVRCGVLGVKVGRSLRQGLNCAFRACAPRDSASERDTDTLNLLYAGRGGSRTR